MLEQGHTVRVLVDLSGGRYQNLEQHSSNPNLTFEEKDITKIHTDDPMFRGVRWLFHMAGIGDIVPSIEKPLELSKILGESQRDEVDFI